MVNMKRFAGLFSSILLGLCICMLPIYLIINYTYNSFLLDKMNSIDYTFKTLKASHQEESIYIQQFLEEHHEQLTMFEKHENKELSYNLELSLKNYRKYVLSDTTLSDKEKELIFKQINMIQEEYIKYTDLFKNLNQINKKYVQKLIQLKQSR